jgi:hypothetical protein
MRRLLTKKKKGISDLMCSMFVVLAITVFVLFFVGVISDVNTKIQMDQVARTYMLRMETTGGLTQTEADNLKTALLSIPAVKNSGAKDTDIEIKVNGASPSNSTVGYGQTITLVISCPAEVTRFSTVGYSGNKGSTLGAFFKKNITYTIRKQSTAKY